MAEAEIWGQTYLLYHSLSMLQTNSTHVCANRYVMMALAAGVKEKESHLFGPEDEAWRVGL